MKASRIAETFQVSSFTANLALLIIRGRVKPEDHPRRFPKTCRWVDQCYNAPRRSEIKLAALDEILGTYGAEALRIEGAWVDRFYGDIVATYLNTGDTYAPTLLLDHESSVWKLTSWGDFYESAEARYLEVQ